MKVLKIISSLNMGGAEKLLIDSVPLYQNANIKVDVLVLSNYKTQFWKKLKMQLKGDLIGLTSKSTYNPFLVFRIIPYLKNYDVVHIHLFPALYWGVIAKWLSFCKAKIIYTEHSTENRRKKYLIFKVFDRFIYDKIDSIVAISKGVQHNLKLHLNLDNVLMIHNGIDLNEFSITSNDINFTFFDSKDFVIIQISSFKEAKDQATLIRSLLLLPKNVKLLLVGEGKLLEKNKLLAHKLKLEDRVKFLGNRNDVSNLIQYSDVVVLSSFYEGFGLSVVEGMAKGKPVIASNVLGINEIVENYGLLFNTNDEIDLAKKIYSLLNDNSFYQHISKLCLKRSKDFDIKSMVKKYIFLYNSKY